MILAVSACTTTSGKVIYVPQNAIKEVVDARGELQAQDAPYIGPPQSPTTRVVQMTLDEMPDVSHQPSTSTPPSTPRSHTGGEAVLTGGSGAVDPEVLEVPTPQPKLRLSLPLEPKLEGISELQITAGTQELRFQEVPNQAYINQNELRGGYGEQQIEVLGIAVKAQQDQYRHEEVMYREGNRHEERVQQERNRNSAISRQQRINKEDKERDDKLKDQQQKIKVIENVIDEGFDAARDAARLRAQQQQRVQKPIERAPRPPRTVRHR